jgi:gamma-glutamyltranspeptidase/glutathione hydrolase
MRLLTEAMRFAHRASPGPAPISEALDVAGSEVDEAVRAIRSGGSLEPSAPTPDPGGTSHLIAVDDDGLVVSLTHSLGYCSGVVTPGLGFLYNDYLNGFHPLPGHEDSLAPGKNRPSSTAPTVLLDDRGPWIVAGAPGATRIAPSVMQALVNIVDLGMGPVEAVSAARIDCQAQDVHLEGRIPHAVEEGLRAHGYATVRHTRNYDRYFARPQVAVRTDGGWRGASDPRGDGGVAIVG